MMHDDFHTIDEDSPFNVQPISSHIDLRTAQRGGEHKMTRRTSPPPPQHAQGGQLAHRGGRLQLPPLLSRCRSVSPQAL